METKEVTIESPIKVVGLTLIPITRVLVTSWSAEGVTSFLGIKKPVAMVVVSQSAKRAFWITGEEVSLEELIKEAPSLKEMLE